MWKIIGFILLIGLLTVAVQVAIALLFLAGLIFRTKETVGLIIILGAFALLSAFPVIGLGLLAVMIVAAIVKAVRNADKEPEMLAIDDPAQE